MRLVGSLLVTTCSGHKRPPSLENNRMDECLHAEVSRYGLLISSWQANSPLRSCSRGPVMGVGTEKGVVSTISGCDHVAPSSIDRDRKIWVSRRPSVSGLK